WFAAGSGHPEDVFPRSVRCQEIHRTAVWRHRVDSDLAIEVFGQLHSISTRGPRHFAQSWQVIHLLILRGVLEEQALAVRTELRLAVFAARRCDDRRLCATQGVNAVKVKSHVTGGGIPALGGCREDNLLPIRAPDRRERGA